MIKFKLSEERVSWREKKGLHRCEEDIKQALRKNYVYYDTLKNTDLKWKVI